MDNSNKEANNNCYRVGQTVNVGGNEFYFESAADAQLAYSMMMTAYVAGLHNTHLTFGEKGKG